MHHILKRMKLWPIKQLWSFDNCIGQWFSSFFAIRITRALKVLMPKLHLDPLN